MNDEQLLIASIYQAVGRGRNSGAAVPQARVVHLPLRPRIEPGRSRLPRRDDQQNQNYHRYSNGNGRRDLSP